MWGKMASCCRLAIGIPEMPPSCHDRAPRHATKTARAGYHPAARCHLAPQRGEAASRQLSAISSQPPHAPAALSMEPLTGLGSAEKCAFIKQVQKLLFEPFQQTRVENKGPRNQSVESGGVGKFGRIGDPNPTPLRSRLCNRCGIACAYSAARVSKRVRSFCNSRSGRAVQNRRGAQRL
jgi:hypothetical protein